MNQLKYYPSLNTLTGSINATLLMLQLEYWFSKSDANSFYKFLEPCEDAHYRTGDSWVEELGFTKAEFRGAFAKIGKVYKSKKEYESSTDKFQGKFYLSYYDRVKRLTYYLRHDKSVEEVNREIANEVLCKSIECVSACEQTELPISVDYNQLLLQEKDLSMTDTPYEQIVEEFNTICTHLTPIKYLSNKRRQALDKLWQIVQGKVDTIKAVFHTIHHNDFLSGRIVGKMWRATFDWIIKQDKFIAIWEGHYADRKEPADCSNRQGASLAVDKWQPRQKKKRFNRMMTHNWDYNLLEQMEQEYIENQLESNSK